MIDAEPEWESLLRAHSLDADHVLQDLKTRFTKLLETLEARPEWITNRVQPPKLILGDFMGVETGLRQLIRSKPLATTEIASAAGPITVPTAAEMLRIKSWLVIQRNATRDYIDVAALAAVLGPAAVQDALHEFDGYYCDVYRADVGRDVSPLLQLARQLADPQPADLSVTDVPNYKGIVARWASWAAVQQACRDLAVRITETGVGGA